MERNQNSSSLIRGWKVTTKEENHKFFSLKAGKLQLKKKITSFSKDVVFFPISPRLELISSLKICNLLQLIKTKEAEGILFSKMITPSL